MPNKPASYIEDLLAREEPILFPPVLHMGKLIPSDLEQCACLNKVYGAARRDEFVFCAFGWAAFGIGCGPPSFADTPANSVGDCPLEFSNLAYDFLRLVW